MKVIRTVDANTIKQIDYDDRYATRTTSITSEEMIKNGESCKEFGVFNDVDHTFIELEDKETISIRTPNGKMITLYFQESGGWGDIDIKVHNENINTQVFAFEQGNAQSIKGSLYAIDMKIKENEEEI